MPAPCWQISPIWRDKCRKSALYGDNAMLPCVAIARMSHSIRDAPISQRLELLCSALSGPHPQVCVNKWDSTLSVELPNFSSQGRGNFLSGKTCRSEDRPSLRGACPLRDMGRRRCSSLRVGAEADRMATTPSPRTAIAERLVARQEYRVSLIGAVNSPRMRDWLRLCRSAASWFDNDHQAAAG